MANAVSFNLFIKLHNYNKNIMSKISKNKTGKGINNSPN